MKANGWFYVLALLAAFCAPAPLLANGAVFFDEEGEHEVDDEARVYFGTVKDDKGKAIVGATVEVKVKGEDIEYGSKTSALGRYLNFRIKKDIDPKLVEVKVVLPGYTLVGAVDRSRTKSATAPVEINFVMKKDATQAVAR